MLNNISSFKHPTIQNKIRKQLLIAWFDSQKNNKTSKQHCVQNRCNRNILRVDCSKTGLFTVYGDCSIVITEKVFKALGIDL